MDFFDEWVVLCDGCFNFEGGRFLGFNFELLKLGLLVLKDGWVRRFELLGLFFVEEFEGCVGGDGGVFMKMWFEVLGVWEIGVCVLLDLVCCRVLFCGNENFE